MKGLIVHRCSVCAPVFTRVHSWPNIHTLVPFLASLSDSLPQLCKQLQPSHLIDSRHPSTLLLFAVTVAPPPVYLAGLSGSRRSDARPFNSFRPFMIIQRDGWQRGGLLSADVWNIYRKCGIKFGKFSAFICQIEDILCVKAWEHETVSYRWWRMCERSRDNCIHSCYRAEHLSLHSRAFFFFTYCWSRDSYFYRVPKKIRLNHLN